MLPIKEHVTWNSQVPLFALKEKIGPLRHTLHTVLRGSPRQSDFVEQKDPKSPRKKSMKGKWATVSGPRAHKCEWRDTTQGSDGVILQV